MTAQFHRSADIAMQQRRLPAAIDWLEQAIRADPTDFEAWLKLSALRRAAQDALGALEAANSALGVKPNEFVAMLLKGSLHEQVGEFGRAAEVYRAAIKLAAEEADLPAPIRDQLARAKAFLAGFRERLQSSMTNLRTLDPIHRDRASRFIENVHDRRPIYHQEPTHYRYPGLPDVEFFDHAYSGLLARLRECWKDIRDEYLALARRHADRQQPYVDFAPGQPMGQWAQLNRSSAWNVFHLIRFGEADPINAALCPRTMAAIAGPDQVDAPGITPNILFSLLAPKTRIPPHHGVANFRTLLHLPLIVPEGCAFRVGGETRTWVEGEPWIFDDTIEQEAWNESDELRVILIADLWRPELDEGDRQVIRDFIRAQAASDEIGAL